LETLVFIDFFSFVISSIGLDDVTMWSENRVTCDGSGPADRQLFTSVLAADQYSDCLPVPYSI